MTRNWTYAIVAGLLAVGCGDESALTDTASNEMGTSSDALKGNRGDLRSPNWEGEFEVAGVEYPFAAYLALGQLDASISGLFSRFDSDLIEWLENRYDISLMGSVSRNQIFLRATITGEHRLVYVLELTGVGSSYGKLPRIDRIDFTASLKVYRNDRLLKEKVAHMVAARIFEERRGDGRLGNAVEACTEICRCEDRGSVPACVAVCLTRVGFGRIPTCVACVNDTRSCLGVKACLGSRACQ